MKREYLPTEDDKTFTMYAFYDENKNEVIWCGCTNSSSHMDQADEGEINPSFSW